jgi:hypothetical protein
MQEINLNYLSRNYLTIEQLAAQTKISVAEIKRLIEARMIPEPSFKVRQTIEISSPLEDAHKIEETTWYFPQSHVTLLQNCREKSAEEIKTSFIEKMRQHLFGHGDKKFAYGNVFDPGDRPNEEKLAAELEKEWNYYCQGIYGICTLTATPQEIIEKEIAVKKLLEFLDGHPADEMADHKSEAARIIEEYDKVSNLFAPYQRATSSRGKYVDRTLEHLKMEDKIKKYE